MAICEGFARTHFMRSARNNIIMMHELEIQEHDVTEFVIDVNEIETRLSCRIFDKPSEAYNDFVTLLQTPGSRRVDLAPVKTMKR